MRLKLEYMYLFNLLLVLALFSNCSSEPDSSLLSTQDYNDENAIAYLALGDSYTIGESVSYDKNYPSQLSKRMETELKRNVQTQIIAKTGWRTDELQSAIQNTQIEKPLDFVTLLIGVNNQYQNKSFSQYEEEFPELLQTALDFTNGETEKVLVISIPDYAFTPFGQNRDTEKISREIDQYNAYAKSVAKDFNVTFVEITDITRMGLEQPDLVARDGLHPSGLAYEKFVDRILPFVLERFKD